MFQYLGWEVWKGIGLNNEQTFDDLKAINYSLGSFILIVCTIVLCFEEIWLYVLVKTLQKIAPLAK